MTDSIRTDKWVMSLEDQMSQCRPKICHGLNGADIIWAQIFLHHSRRPKMTLLVSVFQQCCISLLQICLGCQFGLKRQLCKGNWKIRVMVKPMLRASRNKWVKQSICSPSSFLTASHLPLPLPRYCFSGFPITTSVSSRLIVEYLPATLMRPISASEPQQRRITALQCNVMSFLSLINSWKH